MTVQRARGGEEVLIEPFLAWVHGQDVNLDEMGDLCGVSPKWLRGCHAATNDSTSRIPLHVVDRVLTAYCVPLWSVYPKLYDALKVDEDGQVEFAGSPHEVFSAFCPRCKEMVNALRDDGTCLWCDAQTGGSAYSPEPRHEAATKLIRPPQIEQVRVRYLRGESMPAIANDMLDETGFASAASFRNGMYREFRRRGWPTRHHCDAVNATRARWPRCEQIKDNGERCLRTPGLGSKLCAAHDPASYNEIVRDALERSKLVAILPRPPFVAWLKGLVATHGGIATVADQLGMNYGALWMYISDSKSQSSMRPVVVRTLAKARSAGLSTATLVSIYGLREVEAESDRRQQVRRQAKRAA